MKIKQAHIALLVVALLLLTAIAPSFAKRKKNAPVQAPVERLSAGERKRFDYFFLEAVRQQNAGKYASAYELLRHCLRIDPDAAEAYFMQSPYFMALKQDSAALAYLEKAASLRPDNSTYQERLAASYINSQQFGKATEAYEKLYAANRERLDVLEVLSNLYEQAKNYDKMLDVINRMEQLEGVSEELTLSKVRVYELKDDRKSAYRALAALCESHPNEPNYKVMMGNWLLQNDRKQEAYKLFLEARKADPENTYVQTSLYDYYRANGQEAEAEALMERILVSSKTEPDSKLTMMQQLIRDNEQQGGDSSKILSLFGRILEANPKDTTLRELNVAYMALKKMPQDTLAHALRGLLAVAPDNAGASLQLIQLLWPQQRWDEIISVSGSAAQYNPAEMPFYYFLGLAHYQKDEKQEAMESFRHGVNEVNDKSDPNLVSDMYAMMGDILHDKGKDNEAFAAYDSSLQWKRDNYATLNNYAYYLSELGRDLKKAEQMSYLTIKAEPKNSTYLDTYAWILFKQERYAEAKIYAQQALQNDTDTIQTSVYYEHLGDIHAVLNELPEAVDCWTKALKAGSGSPLLPKKLKLKKYISDEKTTR